MHRCILGTTLIVLLSACAGAPSRPLADSPAASQPATPGLDPRHFGEPVPVPPASSLFTLSAAQEAEFWQYFNDPANAGAAPHQRLYDYLEQRLDRFRYYGATRTAAQALVDDEGNCLTLAMLTTALARLAGVEIAYQRIRDEPVFERHGNVVFAADHVRSLLFDPTFELAPGERVVQRPHLIIDYFPERRGRSSGRIGEPTLRSMFYTNLAGEAMAMRQNREAFWLLRAALAQDPSHSGALNSLAVLHRRVGDEATAERVFRHALDRYGDTPNLLSNYRSLLLAQGREAEVADLDQRLARLPVRNPFDLVELGNYAHLQGRPQQALAFYQKALSQAPYLHEVYWRQAVVYASMGKTEKAEQLLATAESTAPRPDDKRLYRTKAQSLQDQAAR